MSGKKQITVNLDINLRGNDILYLEEQMENKIKKKLGDEYEIDTYRLDVRATAIVEKKKREA